MTRTSLRSLMIAGLSAVVLGACTQTNPQAEQEAYEATKPWLALMDSGEYGRCWESAAPWFRETVTEDAWLAKARETRSPLGELQYRELKTTTYATNPMGAPEGVYTIVVYDSHWEVASILETVSMQRQPDGAWLVVGYHVKQQ